MPQDWKSNVNNLIVVWQGSSWSVIAPNGHVIFRHWDKDTAFNWAKQNYDYAADEYDVFDWENNYKNIVDDFELGDEQYYVHNNFPSLENKKKKVNVNSPKNQPNQPESRETCFEVILMILVFGTFLVPVPLLACFGIATLFFGFRLPFLDSGKSLIAILQHNATLPALLILTILIPRSLMLILKRQGEWSGKLLRQPLTLIFGLLGVVGVLLGLVLIIVGLFNEDLSTWRVIVITILWGSMNYFAYRIAYELRD